MYALLDFPFVDLRCDELMMTDETKLVLLTLSFEDSIQQIQIKCTNNIQNILADMLVDNRAYPNS